MLIISTRPRIETHFKVVRTESVEMEESGIAVCGCTSWYPATLADGGK
jgi:hypothetical protein